MDRLTRTTPDGRNCEYLLLEPVRCAGGEFCCDLVVLVNGVETSRRSTFGVDADQARRLARKLRTLSIELDIT